MFSQYDSTFRVQEVHTSYLGGLGRVSVFIKIIIRFENKGKKLLIVKLTSMFSLPPV